MGNFKCRTHVSAWLIVFAVASPFCRAQTSGTTARPESNTSETALDEIVVTAERRQGRLQDVPFTVSVVSDADLKQAGVTDARELPMLVSGLTWNGQGGWQEPNIRGVYTTVASPGSGNPIAIYVDGVYQASQAGTMLDLPDVSHIEVLKGPQGTLFGRNATGGAIQIFTKDPQFNNFGGDVSLTAGEFFGGTSHSAPHEAVNTFVTGPLIDNVLAGSLSVYYDDVGGYIKNYVDGSSEGSINSRTVRGKLLWKLNDSTSVLFTSYYINHKDEAAEMGIGVNGVTVASQYPGSIIPTRPWQGAYDAPSRPSYAVETIGGSVKITSVLEGLGTFTNTAAYTHYLPQELVDVDESISPACLAAFACIDYRIDNPERTATEELNFASDQWGRFRFVAGVYAFYDRADEYDRIDLGNLFSSLSHIYTKEQALYGEGTYSITDQVAGVLGVRLDHESKIAEGRTAYGQLVDPTLMNFAHKSWTSATPRASLRYQPTINLNTYFTYSQGFKGGVTGTQYNTAPPANPERLDAYELGMKYAKRAVSVSTAVFYYNYKDLQQEFFSGTVAFPRNAAVAHIAGLDLDTTARLTDQFELRFSGSWLPEATYINYPSAVAYSYPWTPYGLTTYGQYDASGTRMLNTPKLTGSLTAVYTNNLSWGRLESSVTAHYSDNYRWEVTGRVVQPAYTMLNAQITAMPASLPNVHVTLYGHNLTSKAVLQGMVLSAISDAGFYGPPREVGATLAYSF